MILLNDYRCTVINQIDHNKKVPFYGVYCCAQHIRYALQLSLYITPTLMYIADCIQLYSAGSDLRFIFVCSFHGIE